MSLFRQFSTRTLTYGATATSDSTGVYVVGFRPEVGAPSNTGEVNAAVQKFDATGNERWTRELVSFATPEFARAASDGTGVYILELIAQRLRKYSSAGEELWTQHLDFRPLAGLSVGSQGVYVAGRNLPQWDPYSVPNAVYLRKYDAAGVEVWTRRWGQAGVAEIPLALTHDSTGVYVVGSGGARKYDPNGNQLWIRDFGIEARKPSLIAPAHPTGFYLVGGGIWNNASLSRYDAAGNQVWTLTLTPSSALYPGGIAADESGLYIAGTTDFAGPALPGQCRSASGVDSFLRKYSPEGVEVWTREFSTPDAAWATDVTLDGNSAYVVGGFGRGLGEGFYPATLPATGAFVARFEKSSPAAASRPRIVPGCVVNSASYVGGGVAPGEIVTLFGSGIGPAEQVQAKPGTEGRLPTLLASTRILFNGVPVPLLYVSDTQSSAIVPYGVSNLSAVDVQVEYQDGRSDAVTMRVLPSRPGIFTRNASGRGQAAILNEDGSINSPVNPARKGSIITIFATGGGEGAAGVQEGEVVDRIVARTSLPVSVVFDLSGYEYAEIDVDELGNGPKPGEVLYAGSAPGLIAGVLQINVRVPDNLMLTGDAAPLALIIGSQWTAFQATFAVR